ncbi:MAG TPA: TolC family protein [Bacteroidales bacterium]|nr:TolC family protein [Bacteroidales bacterium]HPS26551.1 TolC family protein [Bacteroidales bacterium]
MKKIFLFFSLFIPLLGLAQQRLTLEMAIDSALKNNFDIRIARNEAEIGKINNHYGMAGGLPAITAGVSDNSSLYNIHQEFGDGTSANVNNSFSNNLNADISASIVLFNGLKVISAKKRLSYLQDKGFLELNMEIQNTLAAIMLKYFDIIRQEGYLKIIHSTIDISRKKSEIITAQKNVGMANDADMMQAQIDLNLAEQNYRSQQLLVENSKTELIQLMGGSQEQIFITGDTIITLSPLITLDSVLLFLKDNYQYLTAEQQIKISEQLAKEARAERMPSLRLNTAYDVGLTNNPKGNTLTNLNYGPYAGLNLQIPLFNGGTSRIRQKTALLNTSNARLEKENLFNELTALARKTHQTYKNAYGQLEIQQASVRLSEKLVALVLQKFQLNQATILDLKSAQQSYENSAYLLVNLQYQAKVAEIELKRLSCLLK